MQMSHAHVHGNVTVQVPVHAHVHVNVNVHTATDTNGTRTATTGSYRGRVRRCYYFGWGAMASDGRQRAEVLKRKNTNQTTKHNQAVAALFSYDKI